MAYRGDTTDPLEVIINQRRAQRHVLAFLVLSWLISMGIRGAFRLGGATSQETRPTTTRPSPMQAPRSGALVTSDGKLSALALERLLSTAPSSRQAPYDVRCARALGVGAPLGK